jgi:hypothetical protein
MQEGPGRPAGLLLTTHRVTQAGVVLMMAMHFWPV